MKDNKKKNRCKKSKCWKCMWGYSKVTMKGTGLMWRCALD